MSNFIHTLFGHLSIVVASCFLAVGVGAQERRIALVIGNSGYTSLSPLANPVRDAEAISQSLSALGFTVFLTTNLDQEKFRKAIRFFRSRAEDADTTLLYFAGHGATLGGRSYLFPIDFAKDQILDLREAIALDEVLNGLGSNLRSNLVLIDACRDNPLQSGVVSNNQLFSSPQGLRDRAKIGTLISFATTPGHTAYDGAGLHSPFTGALLDHLETPGIDIELMLKRVRRDVVVNTQGLQVPWAESSLLSAFHLVQGGAVVSESKNNLAKNNPTLLSVLSNTGFNQKPILQRISAGISSDRGRLTKKPAVQAEEYAERSSRIKALLCSVLASPLPDSCNAQN